MSAKFDIKERLSSYMTEHDWKFTEENDHVISCGVNIKCKLKSLRLLFIIHKNGYTSYGICHLNAGEEERNEIMKYLTMANYGLRNGNFEMDLSDGEIRYKVYTNLNGLEEVTDDILESSLVVPCLMFDRYGNGLAKLLMGFSDAETEIKEAEHEEEDMHSLLDKLLRDALAHKDDADKSGDDCDDDDDDTDGDGEDGSDDE